ncbi:MAG: GSCFA domain-containing protein [Candidatus Margulisiibacteriota bacterium]
MDRSEWKQARTRLIPDVRPEIVPSFSINKSDKIYTVGSCFARNIEEHLKRYGFNVPMLLFRAPREEMGPTIRPNGILNKFSPDTIFQELKWCEQVMLSGGRVQPALLEPLLYALADGRAIDLHLGGYVPVTKERALARRQEIYDVVAQAFSAQVAVITLGLVEVWFDKKTGLFIQRYPHDKIAGEQERFVFVRLSYDQCRDYLQNTISLIRKYSPQCKFLVTTSPVPLKKTFTDDDVIVANTYSKSVLRAVCGEIVSNNPFVDYFPAYECVVLAGDRQAYEKNLRNVTDETVNKIVGYLAEKYFA